MAAKIPDHSFSLAPVTFGGTTYDVYVEVTNDQGQLIHPASEPEKRHMEQMVKDIIQLHISKWSREHAGQAIPRMTLVSDAGVTFASGIQPHQFKVADVSSDPRFARVKITVQALWQACAIEARELAKTKLPGQVRLENYMRMILTASDALAKTRELIAALTQKNRQDAETLQRILDNFSRSGMKQDSETFKALLLKNIEERFEN